ncbi:hypothetical protein SMSP2_02080 [Limihaloglobus sulfuriphilus]|uniref:HEPN AbiU2-like domain-containing protein n=1 Tax=Limihaloglobus sulfuriphilus TaxID=1851148 RepID=A0A1R7T5S7_9BACT|nr:hypothetical protein [Limihaloglobus sulfuriphilus]AQQ71703.1 hypothetical protein SMSP2_02080 [Limihaloglobus sulfuriphilus]
MNIYDKTAEDVIKPDFFEEYERLHKDIWGRLIQINTSITILETISNYPLKHISSPQNNIFWSMVHWNFIYSVIVLLHGLISDQGGSKLTLQRMKNKVDLWIKDDMRSDFREHVKKAKFDSEIRILRKKAANMRNKIIAHRAIVNDKDRVEGMRVSDVRKLFEAAERLFQACCFGTEYVTTFYLDSTCGGKPVKRDIDELLEMLVKNSYWFNMPEKRGEFWEMDKKYMNKEELKDLIKWRKKLGVDNI